MVELSLDATEEGTYIITSVFNTRDDADVLTPFVPTSATWTLTDTRGAVMNSREDIAMSPSGTIDTYLYDTDLSRPAAYNRWRIFTVEGMYTAPVGERPFKGQCKFEIKQFAAVT